MSSSAGFIGIWCDDCSKDQHLQLSPDGLVWTDIPQPIEGQTGELYTSDGDLMAGVVTDPTVGQVHDVSLWTWADGRWSKSHDGTIDTRDCANDGRSIGPFWSTGDTTIANGTNAAWSATEDGWKCTGDQPNIFIAASAGVFVGAGARVSSDLDEWFWRSTDGVGWQRLQAAPCQRALPRSPVVLSRLVAERVIPLPTPCSRPPMQCRGRLRRIHSVRLD